MTHRFLLVGGASLHFSSTQSLLLKYKALASTGLKRMGLFLRHFFNAVTLTDGGYQGRMGEYLSKILGRRTGFPFHICQP